MALASTRRQILFRGIPETGGRTGVELSLRALREAFGLKATHGRGHTIKRVPSVRDVAACADLVRQGASDRLQLGNRGVNLRQQRSDTCFESSRRQVRYQAVQVRNRRLPIANAAVEGLHGIFRGVCDLTLSAKSVRG